MSSQLSVLSKLCITNTLLHFLLLFQFCRSLRNISLGDCILGKSNVIIMVGWLWWCHQRAPFLVLPRAPPTLNSPLLTILLFGGVLQCLAVLRCCELFVWKIEHQESTVLSFSLFSCNHTRSQRDNGTIFAKFLTYLVILCFDRQCPNKIPLLALSHSIWPCQKNFGLATLLLVTTFIPTACISLAPSHMTIGDVPQYQTFDTALPYLMFNLPLTKSCQDR